MVKKKTKSSTNPKTSDKAEESSIADTSSQKIKSIPHSGKEPETMEELLTAYGVKGFGVKRGETVNGTVVTIYPKEILVDISKKSFGVVAEWELDQVKEFAATLKVGDKVVAQVMNPENDNGYVVLSLRKASMEQRWTKMQKAKESGEDIEVSGLELAKGGLLVDWQGLRGFIPSTQLDGQAAVNPGTLIGRRIKVKVLEVDKAVNRLVLSQKASIMGVTPSAQKERLEKIHPEDSLKGTVSGVASFGIFVDVDGLEGLVHISEIAWEKVEHPGNLYKVGDKVDVVVLEVNKNEGKLNLSIKRLTPDPWKNILDRYPIDSSISGKVVRSAPYGVFVQIEPGIEGLLHISKLIPGQEPKVGDAVSCMIEHIDTVKRKISLTLVPTEKPVGYR